MTQDSDGRSRILKSASALFAERGFRGVSISDVAEAAGLVKSSIYHHFENKEALYLAVMEEITKQSREQMQAGARGSTWHERLRGAVRVLGRLTGPRSHVLSLMLGGMAQIPTNIDSQMGESIVAQRREFSAVLTQEIRAGIEAGDLRDLNPELTSICLIGLVTAALQTFVRASEDESIDFAFDLFLRGASRPDRIHVPARISAKPREE